LVITGALLAGYCDVVLGSAEGRDVFGTTAAAVGLNDSTGI